jgi:hypothetical protein
VFITASFRLYISESDGEVDEDFPPLDRACLVSSTGATTFALRLAPTANGNPVRKGSYSESLEDDETTTNNSANEISRANNNSKEKRRRGERYQQQHDSDVESDEVTIPRTSSSADLNSTNTDAKHNNHAANEKQKQSTEDGGKRGFFACCFGLFGKKKQPVDDEADRRAAHVSTRNASINSNQNANAPFSSMNGAVHDDVGRVRGSSTSQIVGHTVRTSSMDGPLPYLTPALPSTSPPAPSHGLQQHQTTIPQHMGRSSSQNALNLQRQPSDNEYESEESVNVGNAFAQQQRHRNGSALEAALDDDGRM